MSGSKEILEAQPPGGVDDPKPLLFQMESSKEEAAVHTGHSNVFQHDWDQDSCVFTSIRKTSWFLKFLFSVPITSPWEWKFLLASFSIKNDFMFYPPPPTYRFSSTEGSLSSGMIIESKTCSDSDDDEYSRCRHTRSNRTTKNVGATHGIATSSSFVIASDPTPNFEMIFIPWKHEFQSYRIEKDAVVMEQKIKVGSPLHRFSLGCTMPCSIIRPQGKMSSHVAIFFHCNGEDIGRSSCLRLQTLANALHMTILVPEFPGYGLFEGITSEATVKAAMERLVQFLFASDGCITPSRLVLIGHSIGGAVVMHVANYINDFFEKLQKRYNRHLVCPGAFQEELAERGATSFFDHFQHGRKKELPDNGIDRTVSHEPFGIAQQTDGEKVVHCCHNALGGIILISTFLSVRCIEYMPSFQKQKLNPKALELRWRRAPTDQIFPVPESWSESTESISAEEAAQLPPGDTYDTPFLFRMARFLSFRRFPTGNVAAEMQRRYRYFNKTPLLLIHGTHDEILSPIHSVGIATKIRQTQPDGARARVFLYLVRGGKHNYLNCVRAIRRFYKDEILLPHLQRQTRFRQNLQGLYRESNCTPSTKSPEGEEPLRDDPEAPSTEIFFWSGGAKNPDPNTNNNNTSNNKSIPTDALSPLLNNNSSLHYFPHREEATPPEPKIEGHHHHNQSVTTAAAAADVHRGPFIQRQPSQISDDGGQLYSLLNRSVLHSLEQQGCLQAGSTATALHMALLATLDRYDVGSVAVTALRTHALPIQEAFRLYRQHKRRAWTLRTMVMLFYTACAFLVLGVGISHIILTKPDRVKPHIPASQSPASVGRDTRVVSWCMLEGTALLTMLVIVGLHPWLGFGNVSKQGTESTVVLSIYTSLRLIVYGVFVGVGIIMGFVLALSDTVHWKKWDVLPYDTRVWVARLPWWLMVAFASFHSAILLFVIVKNH